MVWMSWGNSIAGRNTWANASFTCGAANCPSDMRASSSLTEHIIASQRIWFLVCRLSCAVAASSCLSASRSPRAAYPAPLLPHAACLYRPFLAPPFWRCLLTSLLSRTACFGLLSNCAACFVSRSQSLLCLRCFIALLWASRYFGLHFLQVVAARSRGCSTFR